MLPDEPLLATALDEAAKHIDHTGCVITVPAAPTDLDALLALATSPSVVWAPGASDALSLVGHGVAARLTGDALAPMAREANALLRGLRVVAPGVPNAIARPRLWGGQTFDPRRATHEDPAWSDAPAASLTLPACAAIVCDGRAYLQLAVMRGESLVDAATKALAWCTAAPAVYEPPRVTRDGSEGFEAWRALVRDALAVMARGDALKLVGARRATVRASHPWHVGGVLRAMAPPLAGSVRVAMQLGGSTLVAHTPEQLVRRDGETASLDALAGSMPRGRDMSHDATQVAALLASEKDLREHAHVVEGIRHALAPFAREITAPASPSVRTLRTVHHLFTPITAALREDTHVLSLVEALHPTPALGGTPRDAALDWIARSETAPRGWYAGPVGWCDADGDGVFHVAIRAALLQGARAWTYAGAGLVAGSDPDTEWAETEAKMAPMRAALGA